MTATTSRGATRRLTRRGISLAHLKFRRRHEHELRVYWHLSAAVEYAERYWNSVAPDDWPKTIAAMPGDQRVPFSSVDLSPATYLGHSPGVLRSLAENTLVNLVTAFEVYLFDVVQRTVFLVPTSVEDSDVTIRAGDLAKHIAKPAPRAWFARAMADRYCRNKTHAELIKRVGKLVKSDVANSQKTECEEWYNWVLVRNAIVHLGGEVSTDLQTKWPSRFPTAGVRLQLDGSDLIRVASIARLLVDTLDRRFGEEIVGVQDQMLLARELYARFGTSTPGALSMRVSNILGCRFSKNDAEQAISEQRRGNHPDPGIVFTHEMLGAAELPPAA